MFTSAGAQKSKTKPGTEGDAGRSMAESLGSLEEALPTLTTSVEVSTITLTQAEAIIALYMHAVTEGAPSKFIYGGENFRDFAAKITDYILKTYDEANFSIDVLEIPGYECPYGARKLGVEMGMYKPSFDPTAYNKLYGMGAAETAIKDMQDRKASYYAANVPSSPKTLATTLSSDGASSPVGAANVRKSYERAGSPTSPLSFMRRPSLPRMFSGSTSSTSPNIPVMHLSPRGSSPKLGLASLLNGAEASLHGGGSVSEPATPAPILTPALPGSASAPPSRSPSRATSVVRALLGRNSPGFLG